jgi:hypothetical protein
MRISAEHIDGWLGGFCSRERRDDAENARLTIERKQDVTALHRIRSTVWCGNLCATQGNVGRTAKERE